MVEIVITAAGAIGVCVYVAYNKIKGEDRFAKIEAKWEDSLLSFVRDNGLSQVDLEFKSTGDVKKKSDAKESIEFIGLDENKGYDFVDSKFEKGYKFGPHIHRQSSEFFYVLEGVVRITKCTRVPEECYKCGGTCGLSEDGELNGFNEEHILRRGDYHFITADKYHTFEALEDSKVIVVTMPPIARRAA